MKTKTESSILSRVQSGFQILQSDCTQIIDDRLTSGFQILQSDCTQIIGDSLTWFTNFCMILIILNHRPSGFSYTNATVINYAAGAVFRVNCTASNARTSSRHVSTSISLIRFLPKPRLM